LIGALLGVALAVGVFTACLAVALWPCRPATGRPQEPPDRPQFGLAA
jgi:hypothetical protein